jgi:hypothetical protein
MPLADYISSDGSLSSATILNFEKKGPTPLEGIIPLTYYYSVNDQWVVRSIPAQILQFKMGKDPYSCEINLDYPDADKVQVVMRRIGTVWYIIESGKNDFMRVNGIKKRQVSIPQNATVVVHIGEIEFVFTTKEISNTSSEGTALTGPPEEGKGEYSLSNGGKELKFPFSHVALLGSNPLCDFYVDGEPFLGLITHISKRLFFIPLALNPETEITIDGLPINDQLPLSPGSIIKVGNIDIVLKLSKELRFSQDFKFVADPTEECLMLLQLDEYGEPGQAYALPPAGRSIFIGRDPIKSKIVIPGSKKISRRHAQAIVYDKTIMLIDNGATNGTFVNTKKIKRRLVHPGDIVRLGDCNFILCFVG